MAGDDHSNGYVRITTLVAVAVPVLLIFAGAISLFVSLSIAPLQRQADQQRDDIAAIRGDLVPRKEHDRDWLAQDERFADLQRQISSNSVDIRAIYTPSDAMKSMAERLDKLESELHDAARHQP